MGAVARRIDAEKAISLGDDLIGVLDVERESAGLVQCLEGAETLRSSWESDFREVQGSIKEIETSIEELKSKKTSIEKQIEEKERKDKEELKIQNTLRMCVQVTRIIPDLENKSGISGYIVEAEKKKFEKFRFESEASPLETCDKLWRMIDS